MREPFEIAIFRRNGTFFVSPAVASTLGFEHLPGVITVSRREDLLPALEAAHAQVQAAWARPKAERFPDGPSYYEAAGASSWEAFLRGTVSVTLSYGLTETEISVMAPDPNYKRLEATKATPSSTHPVDLPLADAATIALKMLDEIPVSGARDA